MMDDYDYERYEYVLKSLVSDIWRDPENLEIGEDIADVPEVKIIFDGYGYNEDTNEQDDINLESYAIFIHRDAVNEGFIFPEHDTTPWCLIHRTAEEVCIYAWYDVQLDEWSFNSLDELSDHKMTNEETMNVLNVLYTRYFEHDSNE
jgi:hypothetical protein